MRLIFFAVAFLAMLVNAACSKADPLRQTGVIELSDTFSAEFDLVDHLGNPATDERFEGKPILIYFGFASCPDVCPAALSTMSASLDRLGKKSDAIQPLFITIDPERDTQEVLKTHLAFDERILGLTGEPGQVSSAIEAMRVYVSKVPMPDSALDYTMDHQSMFFFVNADGEPTYALMDKMTPDQIAEVLEELIRKP